MLLSLSLALALVASPEVSPASDSAPTPVARISPALYNLTRILRANADGFVHASPNENLFAGDRLIVLHGTAVIEGDDCSVVLHPPAFVELGSSCDDLVRPVDQSQAAQTNQAEPPQKAAVPLTLGAVALVKTLNAKSDRPVSP